MNREEVDKVVVSAVEDVLKMEMTLPPDWKSQSFKDDFGADSLDAVEIVMYVEEHCNIEISDDVAENLDTPQKLIDYLNKEFKNG